MLWDLQKGSMLKRISALILDVILVMILATGFGTLVSGVIGYDDTLDMLNARYSEYESEYGISMNLAEEDYEGLSDEERANYEAAAAAMAVDRETNDIYERLVNETLVIMTFGILLAYVVTDIIIPLMFGNGQTPGKKIFSLAVMQTDHTRLRPFSLAVRTVLGKFTVETMIPVLLCVMIYFGFIGIGGTIAMIILFLAQCVALIVTQTDSALHDLMASTVVVDMKSQMIFEDAHAAEEYRQKLENNG